MSKLFRKESIERLSSPERIDQLTQVINPKAWIPLTAMGSLVVVAGVWSVFGRIPLTVTGQGVLLQPHSVVELQSFGQGRVLKINVKSGTLVKKGETLATIDQSSLKQKLNHEKQILQDLLAQNQSSNEIEREKLLLEKRTLEEQVENLKKSRERESILPILRQKNLDLLAKNRDNLQKTLSNLQKNVPLLREKSLASLKEQKEGLTLRLKQINDLLPTLKERLESRRRLLEQQLITGDAVLNAEQQFFENLSTISNLESELVKLDVQEVQIQRQYLQGLDNIDKIDSNIQEIEVKQTDVQREYLESLNRLDEINNKIVEVQSQLAQVNQKELESSFDKTNQVEEVRRKIAQLELQFADQGKIISKYNGRILELSMIPGQVIQSGTRVGSMEAEDPTARMVSVSYFSDQDGKRIQKGMTAQVTPSLVKRERYGGIVGEVKEVSPFPVTTEDITAIIGNPELARKLSQEKAPLEVITEIQEDSSTVSGYKWSSSKGPSQQLSPGTTTTTRIKVGEIAPISYIIPLFRKWTGVY